MTLNEYQEKAMTTCMPSSENFSYMMLNLVGEVGEFASKMAKAIRKKQVYIGDNCMERDVKDCHGVTTSLKVSTNDLNVAPILTKEGESKMFEFCEELKKEAGDILWQLSGLCFTMGWTFEEVAEMNLEKLASRQQRGVIDGNGDNR